MKKIIVKSSLLVATLAVNSVSAATLLQQEFTNTNDCAGYFGDNFGACQIVASDEGDIVLSPVIAKYDVEYDDQGYYIADSAYNSALFPSVDGSEFNFDVDKAGTGTWDYDRGITENDMDPGVRFWVAKASTGFNLFWYVDELHLNAGAACEVVYSVECLGKALVVTGGQFSTPDNKELSHITFYDSVDPYVVPLPASVWLMATGVLALVGVARRRV